MSTPCTQEKTIDVIHDTLERMEKTQDKLVDLLTDVAVQDSRLRHIEGRQEEHDRVLYDLGHRMRDQELLSASDPSSRLRWDKAITDMENSMENLAKKVDKLLRFLTLTTSKPVLCVMGVLVAMIVLGSVSDLWNHGDWLKTLWHFYKQGE